jgi:hypothetical protein
MHILPINTNQTNNNTAFGAVKYGKRNPGINNEVRKLAEKANDVFEKLAGKSVDLDRSAVQSQSANADVAVLEGVIDGKNIELRIQGRDNTKVNLAIGKNNNGRVYRELEYSSNQRYYGLASDGFEELRSTPLVSGNALDICSKDAFKYAKELNRYTSFFELNNTFVQYAKPILETAERFAANIK